MRRSLLPKCYNAYATCVMVILCRSVSKLAPLPHRLLPNPQERNSLTYCATFRSKRTIKADGADRNSCTSLRKAWLSLVHADGFTRHSSTGFHPRRALMQGSAARCSLTPLTEAWLPWADRTIFIHAPFVHTAPLPSFLIIQKRLHSQIRSSGGAGAVSTSDVSLLCKKPPKDQNFIHRDLEGKYSSKTAEYSPRLTKYSSKTAEYSPRLAKYSPKTAEYSPRLANYRYRFVNTVERLVSAAHVLLNVVCSC
jgi:hypothetical protein